MGGGVTQLCSRCCSIDAIEFNMISLYEDLLMLLLLGGLFCWDHSRRGLLTSLFLDLPLLGVCYGSMIFRCCCARTRFSCHGQR